MYAHVFIGCDIGYFTGGTCVQRRLVDYITRPARLILRFTLPTYSQLYQPNLSKLTPRSAMETRGQKRKRLATSSEDTSQEKVIKRPARGYHTYRNGLMNVTPKSPEHVQA